MSDLSKLAKPFPAKLVKKAPQGKFGDYLEHGTVVQALLACVGPFSFRLREILRGDHGDLTNVIVGVVCALTLEIDGREVTIEEVGDCEQPGNWKNDGARLKDATSDSIKRCAARVGLGLHLYCQDDYFLYDSLTKRDGDATDASQ